MITGDQAGRRAWRRRVFRQKRFGEVGDLPGNPLHAATRAEVEAQSRQWKCKCGRKLAEVGTDLEWSTLRLSGADLHALRLRCAGCQTVSSRYVRLGGGPWRR